jgi:hypothetical protein
VSEESQKIYLNAHAEKRQQNEVHCFIYYQIFASSFDKKEEKLAMLSASE